MNSEIFILMYHEILCPEFHPFMLLYTIFIEQVSLKMVSLSHTCLRTLHLFSKPWSEDNGQYSEKTSSIIGRDDNQKIGFIYPVPVHVSEDRYPYRFIHLDL